jgi:hypothetical protein
MQIREVTVQNFKGIASMQWKPGAPFCCLIGAGDIGKTSLLDAIEATLSPRWITFMEADFLDCDTSNLIQIDVTIGELSGDLKSDERFGAFVRGWTNENNLRDEPISDDEPVLTVRLTVDATMEPVWELIREDLDRPRVLSNRDRALFGLVRLSGSDARHLAWGQGSVLARLTDNTDETAKRLAGAYRSARSNADFSDIPELAASAAAAEKQAKSLGAYVTGKYQPGLELGRSGFSSGSIALYDNGIPLRQAGLGTKRLATLAVQKSGIVEGAMILIDEIEHGLEPHRIIGAISQIKSDQTKNASEHWPVGQILMTTHSDVALGEAGGKSLRILHRDRETRKMTILSAADPKVIAPLLRFTPRALLAKRILVLEGNTEIGILSGIKENWPERHDGKPVEQLGATFADGNGKQAVSLALTLRSLGYEICLFRDSDEKIDDAELETMKAAKIPIIEYSEEASTELAVFSASTDEHVQKLLDFVAKEHGLQSVAASISSKMSWLTPTTAGGKFSEWGAQIVAAPEVVRQELAEVAAKKRWFKSQQLGRDASPFIWEVIQANQGSDLARTFAKVETWLYE